MKTSISVTELIKVLQESRPLDPARVDGYYGCSAEVFSCWETVVEAIYHLLAEDDIDYRDYKYGDSWSFQKECEKGD